MGVTFLVFTPLPFVDASSSWALRSKWHRVVIGASGMLVELAIASIAAILWTHTAEGTTVHALAYNMMFIASVSTLLFNGNPFLRYDAYYILLDALEIPNLESRSRLYLSYLVKRYLWGVRKAHDPSHTKGEKGWLVFYALAAMSNRLFRHHSVSRGQGFCYRCAVCGNHDHALGIDAPWENDPLSGHQPRTRTA
jgi:putative peptide zinc metalloprotease protein